MLLRTFAYICLQRQHYRFLAFCCLKSFTVFFYAGLSISGIQLGSVFAQKSQTKDESVQQEGTKKCQVLKYPFSSNFKY